MGDEWMLKNAMSHPGHMSFPFSRVLCQCATTVHRESQILASWSMCVREKGLVRSDAMQIIYKVPTHVIYW